MSAIKNFFKKRKQDIHFAAAGPGRRLGDVSQESSARPPQRDSSQPRFAPTVSAQRAGSAAVARLEEQSRPRTSRTTSGATSAVRQEMAAEKREAEAAQRLAQVYGEKPERQIEVSPHQRIGSVQFKCSLFEEDPPTLGTYSEMEGKIRDYLLASIPGEPIHAPALCIHTFAKVTEVRQTCLDTLLKLMDNLAENPDNPKFRRIRLKNKAIQQRIVAVEGAVQFLEGVGFKKLVVTVDDSGEEEVLQVAEETSLGPEHIAECKEALLNAEAIRPELHRNTTVFSTKDRNPHALSRVDLPPEFYRVTAEELKKEQELRQQAVEQMGMLRTKAMREREAQRELRRYRYCLIRVRFPDNLILQGIFFAHDKVSTLTEWIASCLALDYIPFKLSGPSGQKISTDSDDAAASTLAEFGLAPAAVLNFEFDPDVLRDVLIGPGGGSAVVQYIKEEMTTNIQRL